MLLVESGSDIDYFEQRRDGRRPPVAGAAKAPHPLPRAMTPTPKWAGKQVFFSVVDAKRVIAATRRTPVSDFTPATLASSLSAAAYRFFWETGRPPSPPGIRAQWAADVAKHARALLANFDMDPDRFVFSPPADAAAVLLASDYPPNVMPPFVRPLQTRVELEKTYQFLRAMQLPAHPAADPTTPQALREWWSLCGIGAMSLSFPPEPEAFRVALLGVAHLARHADLAADFYRRRTRELKRLTGRRRFALSLWHIYQGAFGSPPKRSVKGPAVRFWTAVAQRLLECTALPGADPNMRKLLQQWATNPEAIVTQLRDVKAIRPEENVWRRKRDGSSKGGPRPPRK
jgi:hypothetical protein